MAERRATAAERDGSTDGSEAAAGSERMCAVSRRVLATGELIRFVAGPDGTIVPDLRRRLPGRGVWVEARRLVLDKAIKTNVFARGLGRPVVVPPGLSDQVESLMRKRALEALSLACKAGLVVTGFSKVEAAIGGAGLAALFHASDAAEDGCRKLDDRLAAARGRDSVPISPFFSCAELSLALGRPNVIHAALITGGASSRVLEEIDRLERFRSGQAPQVMSPSRKDGTVDE